jgi:hypothetical protein
MRIRAIIGAAAAVALLLSIPNGAAATQAPRTCTWGGTLVASTGDNEVSGHGLTSTSSTQPLHFRATGPLGGQCEGTMVFDGIMDAGASCGFITFHARVFGLAGVTRVVGTNVGGLSPAKLYDSDGNLVGSENAQFFSDPSVVSKCFTPEGVRENPFSSVIELFGTV